MFLNWIHEPLKRSKQDICHTYCTTTCVQHTLSWYVQQNKATAGQTNVSQLAEVYTHTHNHTQRLTGVCLALLAVVSQRFVV